MRAVEKCIVEVQGWPNYKNEIRFYVSENGTIKYGPFKTEEEAKEVASRPPVIKKLAR